MQTLPAISAFRTIEPYIGLGQPVPAGWRPLAELPMLVIVGLTSVGKSSALAALAQRGLDYSLLPDRRNLVSALIITQMQIEEGVPVRELNRFERYPILRRYNERYYGGLANGLSRVYVDPTQLRPHIILNGLRGEHEITFGVDAFPRASFVFLRCARHCAAQSDVPTPRPARHYHHSQGDTYSVGIRQLCGASTYPKRRKFLERRTKRSCSIWPGAGRSASPNCAINYEFLLKNVTHMTRWRPVRRSHASLRVALFLLIQPSNRPPTSPKVSSTY